MLLTLMNCFLLWRLLLLLLLLLQKGENKSAKRKQEFVFVSNTLLRVKASNRSLHPVGALSTAFDKTSSSIHSTKKNKAKQPSEVRSNQKTRTHTHTHTHSASIWSFTFLSFNFSLYSRCFFWTFERFQNSIPLTTDHECPNLGRVYI
jgi:hypothetical protein